MVRGQLSVSQVWSSTSIVWNTVSSKYEWNREEWCEDGDEVKREEKRGTGERNEALEEYVT